MEVAADPGRGIGRDLAPGEHTETGIDNLISRRHDARIRDEGERQEEELWRESERRHIAAKREENRQAWAQYHQEQAERHRASLESLVADHEAQAQRLREGVA